MCTDCNEITIPTGPTGATGATGPAGANGTNGVPGDNGQDGTTILSTYNSTTGIGTPTSLLESILFTYNMPSNTLSVNGDELEIYVYYEYTNPDSASLRVKLGAKIITITAFAGTSDSRILKIKISRISSTSQLWTIELQNSNVGVPAVLVDSSTVDLTTILAVEITGQNNTTSVANQLLVKKVTLYKYSA